MTFSLKDLETMKENLLKDALEIFITPVVTSWIMPKVLNLLESSGNKLNLELKTFHHDLYKNNFEEYLSRRYTKFYVLDTLVFPNYQTLFDILYVPLRVTTNDSSRNNKEIEIKIDCFPNDFLPKYQRVLIQDTAGMGKSTIIKKLFLSCIRENTGVPILVELRKLNKDNKVIDELLNQLHSINDSLDEDFVFNLLNRGDFVFLLDGFDEIPVAGRDQVVLDLQNFIEKAGNNLFLITSRPEESLASFGGFQKFGIQPLVKEEAHKIFYKYDTYSYKPVASELISALEKDENSNIKEFLQNPFLASLLYKTFEYKKDVPSQKAQFFRQIFDALFENHDLTKAGYFKREKYSELDIDSFEKILRGIGYKTMRTGEIEFSKDSILNVIEQVKTFRIGINFNPSDFLKDLVKTVPLFKKEGLSYKWAHKSLQDYFAARFIFLDAKEKQVEVLQELYKSEKHENVFDIYISIDYETFRYAILKKVLNEFLAYSSQSFDNKIDIDLMLERIGYVYDRSIIIFFMNQKELTDKYIEDRKKLTQLLGIKSENIFSATNNRGDDIGDKFLWAIWSKNFQIDFISRKNMNLFIGLYSDTNLKEHQDQIVKLFKGRDYLIVNNRKNNICNLKEDFRLVNLILKKFIGRVSFSHSFCQEEISKINEEIDSFNRSDFI